MGQLADRVRGDPGLALGVLERVRLDARPVGREVGGRPADELLVCEAGLDDLAADGIGERDVAPDVEPEPEVRPLG
jgi:hypothetical protein